MRERENSISTSTPERLEQMTFHNQSLLYSLVQSLLYLVYCTSRSANGWNRTLILSVISPPKVMSGWTNGKRGRHRQKGLTLNLTAEFLYNAVNDGIN